MDDDDEIGKKSNKSCCTYCTMKFVFFMPACMTQSHILSPRRIKIHYSVESKTFPNQHVEEDPTVQARSTIKTSVTDANREKDPGHIDYVCPTEAGQLRTAYSSLLVNELIVRQMYRYCTYHVEIKLKYLQLSIRNGQDIIDMRREIGRWCQIGKNEQTIDVNNAVLCILYLELRCSEKIRNLFNDVFLHRKEPKLVKEYIGKVEKVVNEGKIGLSSHQNQWRFPANTGNDGVATDFTLKGQVGKNILSKSDRLIPIALQYQPKSYR